MKKLAAILLLAIFLFNIGGYRIVFYFLQKNANTELIEAIDKEEYNPQELITIKVPLSLPYQNNWKNFERVDGEIKVNGKVYHYVQRKLVDGEMILQCLPDENKMHLENAKDDFFRLANDLVTNNSTKKTGSNNLISFKNITGDYDKMNDQKISLSFIIMSPSLYAESNSYAISKGLCTLPDQPPEA